MRLERHALGIAVDTKTSAQVLERVRQPHEVVPRARRTHIDVDGGVAGLVQSRGDTANYDELDPVFGEGPADRASAVRAARSTSVGTDTGTLTLSL